MAYIQFIAAFVPNAILAYISLIVICNFGKFYLVKIKYLLTK